jgi:hypothetical protein
LRPLRLAIEGCYPTFPQTDLVMRILGVLCRYDRVPRTAPHDLLIRGAFSDGSTRRRLLNRGLCWQQRLTGQHRPLRLHVSSENPFAENYQCFGDSGCEYGLGHEIRKGDPGYCRMPHWLNYVDFSASGVPSPERWVRLGEPLQLEQLTRPLAWNREGKPRAAFLASSLNPQRRFLMEQMTKVLGVDGFGSAFDDTIPDHTRSSFTKRELLAGYRFSFCPENAIAPGYYTEKIPESFACGAIPIGYADHHVAIDFDPRAFLNLYDYLERGVAAGLADDLASQARLQELVSTPLLRQPVEVEPLISFLEHVVDRARGG